MKRETDRAMTCRSDFIRKHQTLPGHAEEGDFVTAGVAHKKPVAITAEDDSSLISEPIATALAKR